MRKSIFPLNRDQKKKERKRMFKITLNGMDKFFPEFKNGKSEFTNFSN